MIKGCDGSILIESKAGSKMLAEKDAAVNKDLRVEGFDSVKKAKALVESKCPGVVSCADILAIAARDYVHLVSSSPFFPFPILFCAVIMVLPTPLNLDFMLCIIHKKIRP